MKPMPASAMQRLTCAGAMSMATPRASSTSALPHLLVAERLPCLATVTPAPAATSAAAVEMLNVLGAVAAGAAGVEDHVGVDVDLLGQLGHGARHAHDLLGGLALHAQGAEEGGGLGFAHPAAHDLEQHAARLVLGQVAAGGRGLRAGRRARARHWAS